MEENNPAKTVEEWAAQKQTESYLLDAARAGNHWALGKTLNEEEYDEAITAAANVRLGVAPLPAERPAPLTENEPE